MSPYDSWTTTSGARGAKPQPETRGLVLHAAWLRLEHGGPHQLALWAEAQTRTRPRRRAGDAAEDAMQPRPHPFGAKRSELGAALDRLWRVSRPGVKPRTSHEPRRLTLWLPTAGERPVPSPELIAAGWAVDPAASDRFDMPLDGFPLRLWHVNGFWLDAESAGTLLAGLPHTSSSACLASEGLDGQQPELALGADLRFWAAAGKLALDLLVRQRYLPGAIALPNQPYLGYSSSGSRVASYWDAALGDADVRGQFETLAQAMPDLCRAALSPDAPDPATAEIASARALLEDFLRTVVSARAGTWLARDAYLLQMPREPRYSYGTRSSGAYTYAAGYSSNYNYYGTPTQQWLQGLAYPGRPLNIMGHDAKALLDGVNRWHAGLGTAGGSIFRLCFRLSPPGGSDEDVDGDESEALDEKADSRQNEILATADKLRAGADAGTAGAEDETWRLDYFIQARDDLSLLVPLDAVWQERNPVAQFVDRRFEHPHEHVLMALGQAARLFAPLERSLREARPTGSLLSGAEAYGFLSRALPLLEAADFGVLVPAWWQRARLKPALRLEVGKWQRESSGMFGLDAVVAYDWKVALGGDELTREELERLAALKEPLVRVRGKWVELHSDDVLATLRFLREHANGMTLGDALRVSLTGEMDGGAVRIEEVRTDGWIGDLLGHLRSGDGFTEVPQPEALRGTLRPYQLRGLSWLDFLARYGLGACLADDMGLGKSIQLLSLVLYQKSIGRLTRPVLIVCPTSVVGNWEHEAARFAPELRVLVHHGAGRIGRTRADEFAREVAGHDLVLTTYSLLPRDAETLAQAEWGAVVLDEAQNIKNAGTKQSRTARRLRAPVRVALTGTPVENRLSELWSILDFLNPGYLGPHERFSQQFTYAIEKQRDAEATARLQTLVRPFILRRLKTDPTVIADLPEKIEIREYCPLTREQVTLYEAVVRDGLRRLETVDEAMERRGIILAMLTRLKQVCNHPAHLLGDGSALHGRSGKLERLEELIEELLAEGDRALLFTQFTAMGDRLAPYLGERFGVDVLYLHGGVPRAERVRQVERFQSADGPPLFLLSLKAGGTGLNLTNANHVIHFDRWWNPAVENQATDRAFRIGQTRNVQVRKFVCRGTLEERIDAMIEQKRELAENVVGTGEGWITELSTAQLRDLFSLREDALAR